MSVQTSLQGSTSPSDLLGVPCKNSLQLTLRKKSIRCLTHLVTSKFQSCLPLLSSGTQESFEEQESASEREDESEAIRRILSRLADNVSTKSNDMGDDYDYDDNEEESDKDSFSCQLNQGRRIDYVLQVGFFYLTRHWSH